jgi:naphtho-gamma-pyrone polyketide synthase
MFHRVSCLSKGIPKTWLTPDSYHGDRGHPYPSSDDGLLLGSCTGLLSCAAVSSCQNVGELLPLAVEVVVLTIHLGLCVMRVREMVDSTESSSGSWSILISEINEADAANLIRNCVKKRVSTVCTTIGRKY